MNSAMLKTSGANVKNVLTKPVGTYLHTIDNAGTQIKTGSRQTTIELLGGQSQTINANELFPHISTQIKSAKGARDGYYSSMQITLETTIDTYNLPLIFGGGIEGVTMHKFLSINDKHFCKVLNYALWSDETEQNDIFNLMFNKSYGATINQGYKMMPLISAGNFFNEKPFSSTELSKIKLKHLRTQEVELLKNKANIPFFYLDMEGFWTGAPMNNRMFELSFLSAEVIQGNKAFKFQLHLDSTIKAKIYFEYYCTQ